MSMGVLNAIGTVSLVLSGASALLILADLLAGHRQHMKVMNLVWPITALYFGPLGAWAYWKLGRSPGEGEAASAKQRRQGDGPSWQGVFLSTTHCGAGCVLGDIIGEWGVFLIGLAILGSHMAADYAVDFAVAYAAGIAFQYFAIVPMRHVPPA